MEQQARRSRRREKRRRGRVSQNEIMQPLLNTLPLVEVIDEEGIQTIHQASMRLLKETGMLIVDYPSAVETFGQNGATVEGDQVWLDEDTLMFTIRSSSEW